MTARSDPLTRTADDPSCRVLCSVLAVALVASLAAVSVTAAAKPPPSVDADPRLVPTGEYVPHYTALRRAGTRTEAST